MAANTCAVNDPATVREDWWKRDLTPFRYNTVLWFYYRMVEVAYLDSKMAGRMVGPLRPGEKRPVFVSDEALLARDWIARSESAPDWAYARGAEHKFLSFPECCKMLGLDADAERVALLARIDSEVETDTEECWARLEVISAREPVDDIEPLFDAPRVVPALDQMALFA